MPAFVALILVVVSVVLGTALNWAAWRLVGAFFDVTPIGIVEIFFLATVIRISDGFGEWLVEKVLS